MTLPWRSTTPSVLERLGAPSIRTRLLLLVGALLGLGAINIGVYVWSARQRAQVFTRLERAIDRQAIVVEIADRLEDQKRFVDLLGSGVLGIEQGATASAAEQERFSAEIDSIDVRLTRLRDLTEPSREPAVDSLIGHMEELGTLWRSFYANQGVDATEAVLASVSAEPLANDLLAERLPNASIREKQELAAASQAFVQTDRTTRRVALALFALSAIIGGAVAWATLRELFASIRDLETGARRLGAGALEHRIEVRQRDELGRVAQSFNRMAAQLEERSREIEAEREISEDLLLNILPAHIAEELRANDHVEPKYYPDATIVFADLVGFTRMVESLSVERVVRLLDTLFTDYDRITHAYRLEKLKTIGDSYMCAGGLARQGSSHPIDAVMAGYDFVEATRERGRAENLPLSVRIGIHTGPVTAGVVGIDKFAFDIWGDTVNIASRLEAASEPGRINVSAATYRRIKDFFACRNRGQIETKDARAFDMYFVEGVHPELVGEGCPPPEFTDRYRIYFERVPETFPTVLAG